LSYKNLEIWQEARTLVIDIHKMTIEKLPKFELYEEGGQIRKSSKSVKSTIVEGYGRRRYQQEYIRYFPPCPDFRAFSQLYHKVKCG